MHLVLEPVNGFIDSQPLTTPLRSAVLGGHLSFKAISNRYLLDERD